jgi:predicted phosphodiesterase
MRKLVRLILLRPILWLIARFGSAPNRERIFSALTQLKERLETEPGKKGFVIPFDYMSARFIIFSDQHRGAKNGADDFMLAEANYITALKYYNEQKFHFISLGDAEELWENMLIQVKKYNKASFEIEKQFVLRNAFTKIFGNHDLDWDINPTASIDLKDIYSVDVSVLEGVTLQTTVAGQVLKIFCTHGHQGDAQSDGNLFSKFFISKIWAPLQAYLKINPNTPAYDKTLKTVHNKMMYEWAAQHKNLLLITGHTHQPVFESLTRYERLYNQRLDALQKNDAELLKKIETEMAWREQEKGDHKTDYIKIKSSYFNTGCCCFADGDITGLEIADGFIRLIKWEEHEKVAKRILLEETKLEDLISRI